MVRSQPIEAPAIDADDLPLLGEPLAVELANTRYGAGPDTTDFLGSTAWIDAWLEHADAATAAFAPLPPRDAVALRTLRDDVRSLVEHTIAGTRAPDEAVRAVNRRAARAPVRFQLGRGGAGTPWCATEQPSVAGAAGLLGLLAHATVVLLASDDAGRLRRCANPDCTMLFVQHHGRRRWCHDSCGHRLRQAAYHRRVAARSAPRP